MTREIPHRYLQDNDGETYYPRTDMEAVTGLSKDSTIVDIHNKIDELNSTVDKVNNAVDKVNNDIETANKTIADVDKAVGNSYYLLQQLVYDTGWQDIDVPKSMKNNANSSGFECGIREVSVGYDITPHWFIVRSIRLNVSNITGSSMQIAQLPADFVTDNQSFMARNNGYRHPITIECLNNGKVMAFVHPDDQSKTNWVYQEFTWLE